MLKRSLLICCFCCLLAGIGAARAATPNWEVISGTEYNHVIFGDIYFNGLKLNAPGSLLGAFGPGGEADCRGVANIPYNDSLSYYMTVVGNTNGENITFRLYESGSNTIHDIDEGLIFQSDATNGSYDFHYDGLDLAAEDDSGGDKDNITNRTDALTISGTGTNGYTVQLYDNGRLMTGAVATVSGGTFSIDIVLTGGSHTITATESDGAGSELPVSSSLTITIDTLAPIAPLALDLARGDDSGASDNDNITSLTTGLTISGMGEDLATIQLYDNGVAIPGATATVNGVAFAMDIDLSAGTHAITARQTDMAGNESPASPVLTITVAPATAAPASLDLAADDDLGSSATDHLTSRTSGLTITGTGEEGAVVQLLDNGNEIAGATGLVAGGVFAIDVDLPAGVHSITARQTGPAGNQSPLSTSLTLTIDTAIPSITIIDPGDGEYVKPFYLIEGVAADPGGLTLLELRVSEEVAGKTWYLRPDNGWTITETWVAATGLEAWYYETRNIAWDDGHVYTVSARAADLAGNVAQTSPLSVIYSYPDRTITSSAGQGGTITPAGEVGVVNNGSRSFTITPAVGYTINDVLVDGVSRGAITEYTFSNITADQTITASFNFAGTATITASAGAGGSIEPAGAIEVTLGTDKALTITPDEGYLIADVLVDGVSQGPVTSHTFTAVAQDQVITATFERIAHTLSAFLVNNEGGALTPQGEITVYHGGSQSFSIAPDAGWSFDYVRLNGVDVLQQLVDGTLTVDNVTDNATLTVKFERKNDVQLYTVLSLNLSSQTILLGETVDVSGKLSALPDQFDNLSGLTITVTVTDPGGLSWQSEGVTDSFGHYVIEKIGGFGKKGVYSLQASFEGTSALWESSSEPGMLLAGTQAGYAVIVQGRISNSEGQAAHNKTTRRVYDRLRERGFIDQNIMFFNYAYDPGVDNGIDALPTREGIRDALENWAPARMNGSPAPLFVVMVDHGNRGKFYLDEGFIEPAELDGWLATLEDNLTNPTALDESRVIIIGACYSGSFIQSLQKTGRVLITSAAEDEESYKGPMEPDGIRSGEFFVEELFMKLGRGESLANAFETATRATEMFTKKGNRSGNASGHGSFNRFQDEAVQHPLLEDDGSGNGSNVLNDGSGDGAISRDIYLGAGLSYDTNSFLNPAEFTEVAAPLYLDAQESSALLWAYANNDGQVDSAWIEIRPPSLTLESEGGTGQQEINLFRSFMSLNQGEAPNRWEYIYDSFTESGRYEIFYFTTDAETGDLSPMLRSLVYKAAEGNQPPGDFDLLEPMDGGDAKTVLKLEWEDAVDPEGGAVTYNLLVARDSDFTDIVFSRTEIPNPLTCLDDSAGLEDLTTYYWKVAAVDEGGAMTPCQAVQSFHTNNTNAVPGFIVGVVYSGFDYQPIKDAQVACPLLNGQSPLSLADGSYLMVASAGTGTLESSATGYDNVEMPVNVSPGGTTIVNIIMPAPPDNIAPITTADPPGGSFTAPVSITLTCKDENGSGCENIYYTTSGNDPSAGSTIYDAPILIDRTAEVKFFARDKANNSEQVRGYNFTVTYEKGDINGDGDVDLQDLILALDVLRGGTLLPGPLPDGADVNGNDRIDMAETLYLLRKLE